MTGMLTSHPLSSLVTCGRDFMLTKVTRGRMIHENILMQFHTSQLDLT
jgi:hypothetical protein